MRKPFALLVSAATLCCLAGVPVHAQGLPFGFQTTDVGDVGQPGHASASSNQFTVAGAGADIWDSEDAFAFVYRQLDGQNDIETISVTLGSESAAESFAKAGIMMRRSLDRSAAHVVLDVRPGGEVEFMTRDAAGGSTRFIAGTTVILPATLVLQRQTGAIYAWVIQDYRTSDVRRLGSVPFYRGPLVGGLVVNSHDRETLNTAVFDLPSMTTGALWNNREVGDVGVHGGVSTAFGPPDWFSIDAAGDDIWGTADAFGFAFKESIGDVDIVARLLSQSSTQTFAKAALMMRVPTDPSGEPGPGDAHVILGVRPDGNIEFMTRPEAGGETFFLAGGVSTYPGWLRLVRSGNRFEGFASTDGASWRSIGSTMLAAPNRIDTGLAVTSHDRSVLNRARFDQVVVTAGSQATTTTTTNPDGPKQ